MWTTINWRRSPLTADGRRPCGCTSMSDSGREQVLPLADGRSSSSADSLTAPPLTAEQYLRRVRAEASRLPDTFVASSVQNNASSKRTSVLRTIRIAKYPPGLAPIRPRWRSRLMRFFRATQRSVLLASKRRRFGANVSVPAANDLDGMQRLLSQSKQGPLLSTILRFDFLRMLCLLRVIDRQLEQVPAFTGVLSESDAQVASQLAQSFVHQRRDQWLFSLFTLIQPPLSRDIASVLRSILQKAAYARYGVSGSGDHRLARLNVLTTILAHHFGQHDAT